MADLLSEIKRAAIDSYENSKPFNAMIGIVETINPLSVRLDQKLVLNERFLILTNAVRDYKTEITFDNPDIKQEFLNWNIPETEVTNHEKISFNAPIKHEITIYNALKVGEQVILLRFQGGQKYIVLDRLNARAEV